MDLESVELSVGDVRLRGVVIAVVLGFASTSRRSSTRQARL